MSLPAGVTMLKEGRVDYFSQRVTRPPMADCMFAALCTPLSYMGYDLPETFVGDLRKASGVPPVANGKPQGTTTADTRTALMKLLPDAPIRFGGLDDDEMLERIASGEIVVRVAVSCKKLKPGRARRYVGNYEGGHAVAIGAARKRENDGEWEVLWMDPAGPRKKYRGRFVRYARVRDALRRTSTGKVAVTYGEKNAAIPQGVTDVVAKPQAADDGPIGETQNVLTRGQADEFAVIPKETQFFFPDTRKPATKAARKNQEYRLAGRTADGKFAGVWVNTTRVPGASGATLLLVNVSDIEQPVIRSPTE